MVPRPASRPLPQPKPHLKAGLPEALARSQGFRRIAGVDEAGRGPWAGPVVAAAVLLRRRRLPVRIDDSKRLTPRQRERAYHVIRDSADVGVGIVCAESIDRLNILRATLLAMRCAIADLPHPPELALIDGSHTPDAPVPCRAVIGGDHSCYSISCASIIAKVLRDGLMAFYDRLYPGYALHEHKGYGTPTHAKWLRELGPCFLHRLTYEPVRQSAGARATG